MEEKNVKTQITIHSYSPHIFVFKILVKLYIPKGDAKIFINIYFKKKRCRNIYNKKFKKEKNKMLKENHNKIKKKPKCILVPKTK